jgi:GDPmannose 4,6-dehydratase
VNYREAYGMYACNGILFNHESPIRGETFVTRKITRAAARIALGLQDKLYLGNMNSKRDWGHAKDYIEAMYLILQQKTAEDFVIATGETTEIRDFVRMAFSELGLGIEFKGEGLNEKGILGFVDTDKVESLGLNVKTFTLGSEMVAVDPRYFRPTEVDLLLGDASKAQEKLGWKPRYKLADLVQDMVSSDLQLMKKEEYLRKGGFYTRNYFE